jgi:dCMP deaminase
MEQERVSWERYFMNLAVQAAHCVRTVHAEANALVQAACHGIRLEGAQIFVTASPCFNCFKLIVNAGIRNVYFGEFYRDDKVLQFADELGIEMIHLGLDDATDPR